MIRVWIVDADAMLRRLLREQAAQMEGLTVCGESAEAVTALRDILRHNGQNPPQNDKPGQTVFYLFLGETGSGPEWERELALCRRQLVLDIVAVTGDHSYRRLVQARYEGAVDYLLKPFDYQRLREGLKRYIRFRMDCGPDQAVTQKVVDRLYGFTNTAEKPLRLSEPAFRLMDYAKAKGPEGFGAAEAAEALRIASGTARRYLDQLVRQRYLTVEARYASRGRPSHWYRWINTLMEESQDESDHSE